METALISTLGFPIAIVCYLLWERRHVAKEVREERIQTLHYLENAITDNLVGAINELRTEIVKLNERCDGKGKG
jgi:hypothetical protein